MTRIYTKICGITRPTDGYAAASLGANAIGLVFYEKSKRCVSINQAQEIIEHLPPFVHIVALFVNETAANIQYILEHVPIHILQFHGDETAAFCRQFARPYLKAIRVQKQEDIIRAAIDYPDARALLFDAYVQGEYGGTGHYFDWNLLPKNFNKQWILSGGLTPDHIQTALNHTQAHSVDISSGVESSAGIKCYDKMKKFLEICHNQ